MHGVAYDFRTKTKRRSTVMNIMNLLSESNTAASYGKKARG